METFLQVCLQVNQTQAYIKISFFFLLSNKTESSSKSSLTKRTRTKVVTGSGFSQLTSSSHITQCFHANCTGPEYHHIHREAFFRPGVIPPVGASLISQQPAKENIQEQHTQKTFHKQTIRQRQMFSFPFCIISFPLVLGLFLWHLILYT